MDGLDECNTSISPPILLLPLSNTLQDTSSDKNIKSDNFMLVNKEALSTNKKREKDSEYGLDILSTCVSWIMNYRVLRILDESANIFEWQIFG